jgi:hypothetical protein
MSDWLDPVRATLDERTAALAMFIRDDDGGWDNAALHALLQTVARYSVVVDVALIPDACDQALGAALRRTDRTAVRLHQHGRAHVNHEAVGRACEFGASRSPEQQFGDIAEGRARLRDLVGDRLEPIFTPPWNRCTAATARSLADLDFALLSRDATAAPLGEHPVPELPVSLDWTSRRGIRAGRDAWGLAIAECLRTAQRPVGLLLHHAVMSPDDRQLVSELVDVLTSRDSVTFASMLATSCAHQQRGEL